MSRARHKMRAEGGRLSSEPQWNAGGTQNAAKEAEEKKRGGKVKHHAHAEGEHAKKRADKRARGGHVKSEHHAHGGHAHSMHIHHHKKGGKVEERAHGGVVGHHDGEHVHKHVKHHSMAHHPGRARGGRIGADKAPLTTAAKVKHITPGEQAEEGVNSDAHSMKTIKG